MSNIVKLKKRPGPVQPVKVFKIGNLFGEVPLDVGYAGCSHQDCIEGCSIGNGHCQRLEDAFKAAGYYPTAQSVRKPWQTKKSKN